jgi:transcription initiation factor TFIIE subunit alpha
MAKCLSGKEVETPNKEWNLGKIHVKQYECYEKKFRDYARALVDDETLKKVAALFGEDAVRVVEVLKGVYEITDNEIADKTQMCLNMVRKALYSLYDHSIVALRESRDKETGWFIFNWRLQPDHLEGFILNQKRRVLEKLETRLEYEKSPEFYSCQTPGCKRFPFAEAFDLLFKCPNCNKPMMHINNDLLVKILTRKIEQIKVARAHD